MVSTKCQGVLSFYRFDSVQVCDSCESLFVPRITKKPKRQKRDFAQIAQLLQKGAAIDFLQNWPQHRNGVVPKPAGHWPLGHRLGGDGMGAGKIGVLTAAHFGS